VKCESMQGLQQDIWFFLQKEMSAMSKLIAKQHLLPSVLWLLEEAGRIGGILGNRLVV